MATGYARIAHESAPGTEAGAATLSTKKVFIPGSEVFIGRGQANMERDDEIRGASEPVPHFPERFTPEWRLSSRLYPELLGMQLACMFGLDATGETNGTHYTKTSGNGIVTDPDGENIPTGVTKHVWVAPLGPAGAFPKTHQLDVAYNDENVFFVARGCATSELSISTPDTGGAQLTASGPALYADTQSDPGLSATPESVSVRPFMYKGLTNVTWLSGSADATTIDVTITNPVVAVPLLNGSAYPGTMEKDEALVTITGTIALRHPDGDDLDAMKDGTTFATKTRWVSDSKIGLTDYKYSFWIECSAAQYTSEDIQPLGNRRRHDATFGWKAARDNTASVTITLCNDVASYA